MHTNPNQIKVVAIVVVVVVTVFVVVSLVHDAVVGVVVVALIGCKPVSFCRTTMFRPTSCTLYKTSEPWTIWRTLKHRW